MISYKDFCHRSISEATRIKTTTGNIIDVYLGFRGRNYMLKIFFPMLKTPTRREVQDQIEKVYPGAKLYNYQVSQYEPGSPILHTGGTS
tara:strand:+ start:459 stop:725 length:267 start_codon:yes stop_codon:yes gene_type:complete